MMSDFNRIRFRTTRKCLFSLVTWCSSRLRFPWRPCVLWSTTSSRSAAMPWSSVPASRDPLDREWRTSDNGRSVVWFWKNVSGSSGPHHGGTWSHRPLRFSVQFSSVQKGFYWHEKQQFCRSILSKRSDINNNLTQTLTQHQDWFKFIYIYINYIYSISCLCVGHSLSLRHVDIYWAARYVLSPSPRSVFNF